MQIAHRDKICCAIVWLRMEIQDEEFIHSAFLTVVYRKR